MSCRFQAVILVPLLLFAVALRAGDAMPMTAMAGTAEMAGELCADCDMAAAAACIARCAVGTAVLSPGAAVAPATSRPPRRPEETGSRPGRTAAPDPYPPRLRLAV